MLIEIIGKISCVGVIEVAFVFHDVQSKEMKNSRKEKIMNEK